MTSPDFSDYINLTVNDVQPPDLYDAAVEYARTAYPEFEPRAGSVEDALLQSFSYVVSSYVAAVNRIPNGTIEGVLQLFGLLRREPGIASVQATITILTPGGSIDAGTAFIYIVEENGEVNQYPFVTTSLLQAASGSTTISATLDSLILGTIPIIPSGTSLVVAQPSSEILTCVTTSVPVQADVSETDEEYFARGVTFLDSLSTSLCTARQVEAYILSNYTNVTRCKVFDLAAGAATTPTADTTTVVDKDSSPSPSVTISIDNDDEFFDYLAANSLTSGYTTAWITTPAMRGDTTYTFSGVPSGCVGTSWSFNTSTDVAIAYISPTTPVDITNAGPSSIQIIGDLNWSVLNTAPPARTREARGNFIVFTWGKDGYPIAIDERQTIYEDVSSKTPVGINFFMMDVMPVDIYCEVQVEVASGYVGSAVLATVSSFLENYFSPENYNNWSEFLYKNEVVALAASVPGVKRVVEVAMHVPIYDDVDMSPTAGSQLFNNDDMATANIPSGADVADKIIFEFAGSMPRFTVNCTEDDILA